MQTQIWDTIVAGGGPAGLSAALMLGRARRRVLVIDGGLPRNRFADHMHGVLGHEGASPRELAERGRAEAAAYGVEMLDASILEVTRSGADLQVRTADAAFTTRTLIIATGLTDGLPDIPGLAERWGTSVLHCPYCHGWEVGDQRLGVLTTSPIGMHQAEIIRQWSDRVTVFSAGLGPLEPDTLRRFEARSVTVIPTPVVRVSDTATAHLADGRVIELDAIFTAGAPLPNDDLVGGLGLARTDSPFGSFLTVDITGRTSDDRVWAVGNVVNPGANVPMSIGAGAGAGAAVNGALVALDTDAAMQHPGPWPDAAPGDFWEDRYAAATRVWSDRVNEALADVAGTLIPGRALDLGCGEGADVRWLAAHGWDATGIDISRTAIARARDAAASADLDGATFLVGDLSALPEGTFDLVTASFFHSPVALAREEILRNAAAKVRTGGHLLVTSHSKVGTPHGAELLTLDEELALLALDDHDWQIVTAELRDRESPRHGHQTDLVIIARRR